MPDQLPCFLQSVRCGWKYAIILFGFAFSFFALMPSVQAQDGSGDPVATVEVTVGDGSTGGMTGNGFAWRDQISSVPVTITCTDKKGKAVANASVSISITSPGTINPTSGTTDNNGNVSTTVASTDISMDDATVTVSASSQNVSGSAKVLLKGVQVVFSPASIRMGVFMPASDTATVTPANDATRISVTTTGQPRASVSAAPGNATSGTIVVTLTGQSGTDKSLKQGDEWLVPNVSGSNKPMVAIVVVVPAAIRTPHPTYNGTVTPINVALDPTTSPADPSVPAGYVYLATTYVERLSIQVVDQFGDNLDQLYAGAPVVENGNIPINVTMSASGTYSDPVGDTVGRDNGPSTVLANSQDATQWTSIMYTHHAPMASISFPPSNVAVSIAGISLNPAVVGRVVTTQSPDQLTIAWPN